MTKLVAIFENSQRLALTAVEEAQRFGHPAVDVEHLFLALALSKTAAGISLREAGVTIDGAREAVQAEHDERLAALGVRDVPVPAVRMPTAGLGEIEWNERALGLFSRATGDGDVAALLQALIDEPGGFVRRFCNISMSILTWRCGKRNRRRSHLGHPPNRRLSTEAGGRSRIRRTCSHRCTRCGCCSTT